MNKIAVITTFGNHEFEPFAKKMLQTFMANWPNDIRLWIQLDDTLLSEQVIPLVRPSMDAIATDWLPEHRDFVTRNKSRDDPQNYRFQATRFCHKVFAIYRAYDAMRINKANGGESDRYLIWMDADVHTTRHVTLEDLKLCLPKQGDALAYMGRKDWPHSECGWLAFDLDNGGGEIIEAVYKQYVTDGIFKEDEWHDSWIWDKQMQGKKVTNLTPMASGAGAKDVWHESPMGKWSVHYKGPVAKAQLTENQPSKPGQKIGNIHINTKNALEDKQIQSHIEQNQKLIKNWIKPCKANDEKLVIVSAGPMLIPDDIRKETGKIVAVKHALLPLKRVGIKPWACILLDPRDHMSDFVMDADPDIIWFVASQVDPQAVKELLARGCTVYGYHAAVGANENFLTQKQSDAIIVGGSATATRGLYMLYHLGFRKFKLYGYDLCEFNKPEDLHEKDKFGQPKYFEFTMKMDTPAYSLKREFLTEAQLIAQYQEMNTLLREGEMQIEAEGMGIVPFMMKCKELEDLHKAELKARIENSKLTSYKDLLHGRSHSRADRNRAAATGSARRRKPQPRKR